MVFCFSKGVIEGHFAHLGAVLVEQEARAIAAEHPRGSARPL